MAGLKEFFEKLESDTDLQEKVKAAEGEEALLKVIADAGYDVKPEELKKFIEEAAKGVELSDGDLENVAGGSMPDMPDFFNLPEVQDYDEWLKKEKIRRTTQSIIDEWKSGKTHLALIEFEIRKAQEEGLLDIELLKEFGIIL